MTKYWLCLTNDKNWSIIKNKQIYAFNKRYRGFKKLLSIGDFIIFYIVPKRIGGIFSVTSKKVPKKIKFFGGEYPYQIKIKKEKILSKPISIDKVSNIKQKISIFRKARSIGSALFGRAIINLTEEDYKNLSELINKGYLPLTDNQLFKNLILRG